jgi:hypothetical protein
MDKVKKKQDVTEVIKYLEAACHECIERGEDLKIPNGENPLILVDSVVYTMVTVAKAAALTKAKELKAVKNDEFAKDTDPETLKKQTWH